MNLVDMILFNAVHSPEKIAIVADQVALPYGQLGHGILAAQRKIAALGLEAGSLVGVHIKHPIDHIVLSAALYRLGLGSMPIDAIPAGATEVPAVNLVLSDRILPPDLMKRFPGTILLFDQSWFKEQVAIGPNDRGVEEGGATWIARALADPDDGSGAVVTLTAGQLSAQMRHYYMSAHARWDRMVTTLEPGTNPGFLMPLMALWLGRLVCCATPETARELAILHGHDYLVTSLGHAETLHRLQQEGYRSIQGLRGAYILGDGFTREAVGRAQSALCGNVICGLATAGAGVVAFAPASHFKTEKAAAGLIAPWTEVEVRDAAGRPVGAAGAGGVYVRLKPDAAVEPAPWRSTGRSGRLDADGMLAWAS